MPLQHKATQSRAHATTTNQCPNYQFVVHLKMQHTQFILVQQLTICQRMHTRATPEAQTYSKVTSHLRAYLFSCLASGLSKGRPRRMKVSAKPCTPRPIGRCRRLLFRAVSTGYWLTSMTLLRLRVTVDVTSMSLSKSNMRFLWSLDPTSFFSW